MGNIVLCGFMGCGKTTVGTVLARMLRYSFVDMDEYIVQKAGLSVTEIFARFGEEYFRNLETAAARELSDRDRLVISAGGGAVLRGENVGAFKSSGVIVLINVPFAIIQKRLESDRSRPLLNRPDKDRYMRELFEKRAPLYLAAADIVVSNPSNVSAIKMAENIAVRVSSL